MHTSIKRWWLLALCGVLDAMVTVTFFLRCVRIDP